MDEADGGQYVFQRQGNTGQNSCFKMHQYGKSTHEKSVHPGSLKLLTNNYPRDYCCIFLVYPIGGFVPCMQRWSCWPTEACVWAILHFHQCWIIVLEQQLSDEAGHSAQFAGNGHFPLWLCPLFAISMATRKWNTPWNWACWRKILTWFGLVVGCPFFNFFWDQKRFQIKFGFVQRSHLQEEIISSELHVGLIIYFL